MLKYIPWILGSLGTLVLAMTQISVSDAKSNVETWLNLLGFDPAWAKLDEVDSIVFYVCLVLVIISFAVITVLKREKSSTSFEILFEQGEEPFLWSSEGNHSKQYTCRFGIMNNSDAVLNNLQVKIHEVIPAPDNLMLGHHFVFPYNLRFQHDDGVKYSTFDYQYSTHETLQKKDKIFVNVLQCLVIDKTNSSNIELLSANSSDHLRMEVRPYKLKILVSSNNGGSKFIYFEFDPTKEEKDMWVMING